MRRRNDLSRRPEFISSVGTSVAQVRKPLSLWIQIPVAVVEIPTLCAGMFYVIWHFLLGSVTAAFWQLVAIVSALQFLFVAFAYWRGTPFGVRYRSLKLFVTVLGIYLLAFLMVIAYYAQKLSLLSAEAVRYFAVSITLVITPVMVAAYYIIKPISERRQRAKDSAAAIASVNK
jgi:hypothetical protein